MWPWHDSNKPRAPSSNQHSSRRVSSDTEDEDDNPLSSRSKITVDNNEHISESPFTSMERLLTIGLTMTRTETIAMRQQLVPKVCALHFEKSPLKVSMGQGQYLYDDTGMEYLDCVNCVAHVGHCHPQVVRAGKEAMLRTGPISYGATKIGDEYIQKLKTTLPSQFDVFLFTTSVSEANDLALRLARSYTGGTDVIVVEGSFHGSTTLPNSISPRSHVNSSSSQIPKWVHVIPCPDLYRGKYREDDPEAVDKYINEARQVIQKIVEDKKGKLACLICESIMSIAGIIIPPSTWMKSIYEDTRRAGGLVIADEAQTGLGRCCTSWWAFQHQEVIPDIITIGKPLGNGHPMAVVVTKSTIATALGQDQLNYFKCDNVTGAIGMAVLNTIRNENLFQKARNVGSFLLAGLKGLANEHQCIGDVRGVGLMVGIEIVYNQETRKPAKEIAEKICYMMKDNNIIMGNDGIHKNVLIIMPPMCFTCENAHRVIMILDKILKEIVQEEDYHSHNADAGDAGSNIFSYTSSSSSIVDFINLQHFQGPTTSTSTSFGLLNSSIFDDSELISPENIDFDLNKPTTFVEMD